VLLERHFPPQLVNEVFEENNLFFGVDSTGINATADLPSESRLEVDPLL
jgi:hypothetical protein